MRRKRMRSAKVTLGLTALVAASLTGCANEETAGLRRDLRRPADPDPRGRRQLHGRARVPRLRCRVLLVLHGHPGRRVRATDRRPLQRRARHLHGPATTGVADGQAGRPGQGRRRHRHHHPRRIRQGRQGELWRLMWRHAIKPRPRLEGHRRRAGPGVPDDRPAGRHRDAVLERERLVRGDDGRGAAPRARHRGAVRDVPARGVGDGVG